jgi:predicted enzyme related to lactoylglutathione lyase
VPNPLCHFAIHADDCQRAMSFYQGVFGWRFEPWGPPGFWRIHTGQQGVEGALHRRHEALTGTGIRGFECSISVRDVAAIASLVTRHGGQVVMPGFVIQGVGTVMKFQDTEGNCASAIQYMPGVFESMGAKP